MHFASLAQDPLKELKKHPFWSRLNRLVTAISYRDAACLSWRDEVSLTSQVAFSCCSVSLKAAATRGVPRSPRRVKREKIRTMVVNVKRMTETSDNS
jgi:hypothetical protein